MRSFVESWTRALGPPVDGRERIVLVPPDAPLAEGWAACLRLLGDGRGPVRLVATGATVERHWPEWARAEVPGLVVTDIDGYIPTDKAPVIAELVPAFEAWLARVLDGVVPGARPEVVFWSSACERLFSPMCEAYQTAHGLATFHPFAEVTCVAPDWIGHRMLRALVGAAGDEAPRKPTARHAALLAATGAAALASRARSFAAEAPSRAHLRALHASEPPAGAQPRVWIAVVGSWPRACRSVTDGLPALARQRGERIGVLLQDSLATGLRTTAFSTVFSRTDAILPTLAMPELAEVVAAVDQGVSAMSWDELARVFSDVLALWPRIAARAAATPLMLPVNGRLVAAELDPFKLAKLLTLDVLRAREAWHAAAGLASRRRFAGATLAWSHENSPGDAVVDQRLQAAGATTIEICHGITELGQQLAHSASTTTVKALWTLPEAAALARHRPRQRCVGGYCPRPLPRTVARPPLGDGEPARLLIISNYMVSSWGLDPRTYEAYQRPILRAALEAQARWPLTLRWRPHPADDPEWVARIAGELPGLERSSGELDADLRWCHVLVSSVSSSNLEALFYDVPVFVHEIPAWDHTWLESYDRGRLFGREHTLVEQLAPCLELLRAGDPRLLAPEQGMRRRLFGATGVPRSPGELVWPAAERGQLDGARW
jgi:hypothetical protein